MRKFNVFGAEMTFDASDPEPFRAGSHRFGSKIGASRLGATVYELVAGPGAVPGSSRAARCRRPARP